MAPELGIPHLQWYWDTELGLPDPKLDIVTIVLVH